MPKRRRPRWAHPQSHSPRSKSPRSAARRRREDGNSHQTLPRDDAADVEIVLKDQKVNEMKTHAQMDSLRKRAESYKLNQKLMLAEIFEEAMALVIDWRQAFGFSAEEDIVQQPKVQHQVVKRPH